jgi:phage virion morphogenesis protein
MIEIQIDSHAVERALQELIRHVDDMTPAMRDIGEHIASLVDLTFTDAKDPYGNLWAALSPVTISMRRRHSSKPLNDTGHLKQSITSNPSRDKVEIGTNEIYGKTHQLGAEKHSYSGGKTPWGDVPARPFLPTEAGGLPGDWEQDILDIIRRRLELAI